MPSRRSVSRTQRAGSIGGKLQSPTKRASGALPGASDGTRHALYPLNRFFHENNLQCVRFLHALARRLGGAQPASPPGDVNADDGDILPDEKTIARLKREANPTTLSRLRRRINAELKRLTRSDKKQHVHDDKEVAQNAINEDQKAPPPSNENWNYDEEDALNGPAAWPLADGKSQSPIDLPLRFATVINLADEGLCLRNYCTLVAGHFVNNGRSVQFMPDDTPTDDLPQISGGRLDQTYRFVQYHFHWSLDSQKGSEHSVDGHFYSAELHLVHQGLADPSKLAVLGVFLEEKDAPGEAFEAERAALGRVRRCGHRTEAPGQRLIDKLPARRGFARYAGSLTTPPCTENVTWTVFTHPLHIPSDVLAMLRALEGRDGRLISCNCRPLRSINDREVQLALT